MPDSSACRGKKQCAQCPKAVDNAIVYASHPRGFHLPARKCEENIMIFLLKGEVLVNSQEYAGTVLHAGEFILQAIGSKYEILAMRLCKLNCVMLYSHSISSVGERPAPRVGTTRPAERKITTI